MDEVKYKTNPALAGQLRHLRAVDDIIAFQQLLRIQIHSIQKFASMKTPEPETYFMRMAISSAHPDDVTVLLGQWEAGTFYVASRLETRFGLVRSSWIMTEEIPETSTHPKKETSMTELFSRASEIDVSQFEALDSGSTL